MTFFAPVLKSPGIDVTCVEVSTCRLCSPLALRRGRGKPLLRLQLVPDGHRASALDFLARIRIIAWRLIGLLTDRGVDARRHARHAIGARRAYLSTTVALTCIHDWLCVEARAT